MSKEKSNVCKCGKREADRIVKQGAYIDHEGKVKVFRYKICDKCVSNSSIKRSWVSTVYTEVFSYIPDEILKQNPVHDPDFEINFTHSLYTLDILRIALGNKQVMSRKKGYEVSVTMEDLRDSLLRWGPYCWITGELFRPNQSGHRANPFAPTLDRIDPGRGYHKDNVRLVCWAANCAMGQWGYSLLEEISWGILSSPRKNALRTLND